MMYQEWRQWARLVYACLLLAVVWYLIQPTQLAQMADWQVFNDGWEGTGLMQVVLFTLAAGLIFPKSKRLEVVTTLGKWDSVQYILGLFLSAVAWWLALF